MADYRIAAGERLGDQIVIGDLKKGVDRPGFVGPTRIGDPSGHMAKGGESRRIRLDEEGSAPLSGPCREFIASCFELVADLLDAIDEASSVACDKPVPEGRAEKKP